MIEIRGRPEISITDKFAFCRLLFTFDLFFLQRLQRRPDANAQVPDSPTSDESDAFRRISFISLRRTKSNGSGPPLVCSTRIRCDVFSLSVEEPAGEIVPRAYVIISLPFARLCLRVRPSANLISTLSLYFIRRPCNSTCVHRQTLSLSYPPCLFRRPTALLFCKLLRRSDIKQTRSNVFM